MKIKTKMNKIKNMDNETAKREKELEQLRADLADIDKRRTAAIDTDDINLVEQITRERADKLVQIEAREAINARKNAIGVSREEIAAAWAEDCGDYQKQIDKAEKEFAQIIRQAADKALVIADLVNAAWNCRVSALMLAKDEEPTSINGGNSDFTGVNFTGANLNKIRPFFDDRTWTEIRPDALMAISSATRDKFNRFYHKS